MNHRPELAIIVAVNNKGVIGKDKAIPWSFPEDLQFFRRLTMGHALIMGRRTCESLPHPLEGRQNLVLSRSCEAISGYRVFSSLSVALAYAYTTDSCPFIIGGARVYEESIELATRLYLTKVDTNEDGDVFFPRFSKDDWELVEERAGLTTKGISQKSVLRFTQWKRRSLLK